MVKLLYGSSLNSGIFLRAANERWAAEFKECIASAIEFCNPSTRLIFFLTITIVLSTSLSFLISSMGEVPRSIVDKSGVDIRDEDLDLDTEREGGTDVTDSTRIPDEAMAVN